MNNIKEKVKNTVIAFINLGLFYTLPILFSSVVAGFIMNGSNTIKDLSLLGVEFLTTLILCLVNFNLLKTDFQKFKKNYKNYLDEGFKYYVIGLLLMIISNLVLININGGSIANNEELNRSVMGVYPLYAFSSILLLGPINEEITFRGGFKKAIGNIVFYTVFTGILFGGAHIFGNIYTFTDVLFIVPYSLLGIMFSYMCYKTDNIFTSICIHMFHNSLSVIIILLGGLL